MGTVMTKNNKKGQQRGAILIMVAIFAVVIIAALAFAIDINHLAVVRNELQNAADAGALAGAGDLYTEYTDADGNLWTTGTRVNPIANQSAFTYATANQSDKFTVEVAFNGESNTVDIQRGHWSSNPASGREHFTPSESLDAIALWGVSEEALDQMDGGADGTGPIFINAVRVVTHRKDQPAISFFAKLFGFESFVMQADAVAMIGFAGSLGPYEADQPIVLCEDTLTNDQGTSDPSDDVYECNIGRMLDSGASCQPNDPNCTTSINTAGWTDMNVLGEASDVNFQCGGSSSASDVKGLVCDVTNGGANPTELEGGDIIQATNGVQGASYNDFKSCWEAATNGEHPYQMKLPVVNCGSGNQVDNCVEIVGAVTVNMLYMSDGGTAKPEDTPTTMSDPDNVEFEDWSYPADCNAAGRDFTALVGQTTYNALTILNSFPDADGIVQADRYLADERWQGETTYKEGMARWDCFVDHFNLINTNNKMAPLSHKAMYFMPDCTPHPPSGITGGENFGVLADIPVLVE